MINIVLYIYSIYTCIIYTGQPPLRNKSDPPSSNTSDTFTRLIPFSAPVVRHRATLQQVRSTLCSKHKSTSAPLRRVLTFRYISTPLRICTYAQLPQARETRQTCRKACPALEQKPTGKARPSGLQHIPKSRTPHQPKAAPALRSAAPPSSPSASKKQTHSVRSHSGLKDGHEASNKQCTQTFLPRCQSSVPKKHRESQEDRIPGQAAITGAPRWNFQIKRWGLCANSGKQTCQALITQ